MSLKYYKFSTIDLGDTSLPFNQKLYNIDCVDTKFIFGFSERPFTTLIGYNGILASKSNYSGSTYYHAFMNLTRSSYLNVFYYQYYTIIEDNTILDSILSDNNIQPEEMTTLQGKYTINSKFTPITDKFITEFPLKNTSIYRIPLRINYTINDILYNGFFIYVNTNKAQRVTLFYENGTKIKEYTNDAFISTFENSVIDFGTGVEIPTTVAEWFSSFLDKAYDNSYTIKSYTGETTFLTEEKLPPIKQAKLSNVSNLRTLEIIGVNDLSYTYSWTGENVKDKQFIGLSLSTKSNITIIPLGKTVELNIEESTNFYESFGVVRPIINGLTSGFYKNTASYNRIDKTDFLNKVGDVKGIFRNDIDIIHPVMRYQSDVIPDFNYAIIEELNNRCYYIDNITYIGKGLWQLEMSIDVLMSYKNAIFNLKTFVTRNQYDYNTLINDEHTPLQQGENVTYDIINNELFNDGGSFVLQGLLLVPGDVKE